MYDVGWKAAWRLTSDIHLDRYVYCALGKVYRLREEALPIIIQVVSYLIVEVFGVSKVNGFRLETRDRLI